MFPPAFEYVRASSVEDALDRLASHDGRAELLAGGHSLIPALKGREIDPDLLVDIGEIDALGGIEFDDEHLSVGATVTYATLLADDRVHERCPVLAEATRHVGDGQIRNRGTVGGNLAEAHPAADLPAAALVADATLVVRGRDGERRIPAGEFFLGGRETAIAHDEILTTIEFPTTDHADGANGRSVGANGRTVGGAYAKKTHPASGYATVGVAARLALADGTIETARVAANGVVDRPVRLGAVEDDVVGSRPTASAVETAVALAGEGLEPTELRSDVHVSGEFRVQLLEAYAGRAIRRALDRAGPGKGGGRDE